MEVRVLNAGYILCNYREESRGVEKALAYEAVKENHLSQGYLFLQDIHDQDFVAANQVDSKTVFVGWVSVQLAGCEAVIA